MFVENEHKRTFLENVVKDHNAKKNTMEVTIASNQTKSRGYLIYDQKLGNNFKRWKKALLSHLTRSYKAFCVKAMVCYYLIVILQCASWIVYAMVDVLANQRKKY